MQLFSESNSINLKIEDGEVIYYPNFVNNKDANLLFEYLLNQIPWQLDKITVFGKTYNQPRLTSFYSELDTPLKYSNVTMYPHKFDSKLLKLKKTIEQLSKVTYNCCLLNQYRDGNDSNGWHADDEKQLGKNPEIASLSLGAERMFHLKHKFKPHKKEKIKLQHGSLLLMKGATQHYWLHQIPKTKQNIKSRINLTFRSIKEETEFPQTRFL